MKHLDDFLAVDVAEGRDTGAAGAHAAECARCRQLVERFRRLLDGLTAARAPLADVPDQLLHWARTCARTVARPAVRPSFLQLLAFGAQPMAAVRGGPVSGAAVLYGDHRFQVDLQVEPTAAGGHRLLGQIVPLADAEERIWQVSVVTEDGAAYGTVSDGDGEFAIDELGSWNGLSLVAASHDQRLLIPRLSAAEDDTGA